MKKNWIGISVISVLIVTLVFHHIVLFLVLRYEQERTNLEHGVDFSVGTSTGGIAVQAGLLEEYQQYEELYAKTVALIRKSSKETEKMSVLVESVWYNSIWKKDDIVTNSYTQNGKADFFPDYRDALSKLMKDENIANQIDEMNDNLLEIQSMMHILQKEPEGYEKAKVVLKKAYEAYIGYYECVLDLSCTYTEYVEVVEKKYSEFNNNMDEVYLYVR